jgi:hypothetical protein
MNWFMARSLTMNQFIRTPGARPPPRFSDRGLLVADRSRATSGRGRLRG